MVRRDALRRSITPGKSDRLKDNVGIRCRIDEHADAETALQARKKVIAKALDAFYRRQQLLLSVGKHVVHADIIQNVASLVNAVAKDARLDYTAIMKIIILGGKGYLGQQFAARYPSALVPSVDIADQQTVSALLEREKPDVVINTAGKTGRPNVDWCEDHKLETIRSNVTGPLVLLEEALKRDIRLVHIGSGCIYQGDKDGCGWHEEDAPNYEGSFYSRTKLWSDQMLQEFPVLNIRLRMPFDGSSNPRNLLVKLHGYTRVLDQPNSLTYIPEFLDAIAALIEKGKTGTYNIVNPGGISPYEIMEMYREIVDPTHAFERLTVDRLGEVVKAGRSNCILSPAKLEAEGIRLRPAREVVREALQRFKGAKL